MVSLGKKFLVYGICSMLGSPFMVLPSTAFATPFKKGTPQTYTVYHGGTIYTMTESVKDVQDNIKPHKAEVVVVDDLTGRIKYVGSEKGAEAYFKNKNNKKVDLGNNVMLPGFIDPHGHFPAAASISGINLNPSPIATPGVNTLTQLQEKLVQHTKDNDYSAQKPLPANWVSGSGYDDTLLDIKRHPSHEELNGIGENGSGNELANYFVKISHSSGHMSVVNTKALKLLFDNSYIQGALTKILQNQGLIPQDKTAKSAKLEKNKAGEIKYVLTLNDGSTTELAGIQMRKADANFDKIDPSNGDQAVNYMTGLLLESASNFVAATNQPGNFPFIPKVDQFIPYAAKEYISRGVTSANDGGTFPFSQAVYDAQKALVNKSMPLRMVIQPRIYLNFGAEINENTLQNHFSLGWDKMVFDKETPAEQRTIGEPTVNSPQTGDDLTTWYSAYPGPTSTNKGKPGKDAAADTYANQLYLESQKDSRHYQDRLMLGTWKYNYDGSIQGYTGYLAQQGYFKKPEDTLAFNPAGRISDADGSNAEYKIGGTPTVTDPKYFCVGGAHYGNEKSLGDGTYTSVAKAVKDYHLQSQGVSLHLNGSWANDDVINFVEQAVLEAKKQGKNIVDTRHTVIHAQMQELQHIQRIMGNYNQFPIDTPENVKKFSNVWTGVNAMTWVKDAKQDDEHINGIYNPEEGHYKDEFAKGTGTTGEDLRDALGRNPETNLMREQHMVSSYFVDHTYYWGERHRDIFMGPGRAYNMSPMGWAVALGHRYTFHNDTPVTPQNPLKSITAATTRLSSGQQAGGIKAEQQPIYGTPGIKEIGKTKKYYATLEDQESGDTSKMVEFHDFDQRITVLQALHAVTVNSAYSSKIEDRFGSIKEGYWADFVILGQDPFELEKQGEAGLLQIANIPVIATIVANDAVFGFLPGSKEGTNFVAGLEASYYNNAKVTDLKEVTFAKEQDIINAAKDTGRTYMGSTQFSATLDPSSPSKTAVFTIQVMGNNDVVGSLKLHKLVPFSKKEFTGVYGDDVKEIANDTSKNLADGKFWVTTLTLETPLEANAVMKAGQAYYIHFGIKDNGEYDINETANVIDDPLFVTANGIPVEPTVGGPVIVPDDDGGCTVGTKPHYDFAILFTGALGLLAVRIFRRREND